MNILNLQRLTTIAMLVLLLAITGCSPQIVYVPVPARVSPEEATAQAQEYQIPEPTAENTEFTAPVQQQQAIQQVVQQPVNEVVVQPPQFDLRQDQPNQDYQQQPTPTTVDIARPPRPIVSAVNVTSVAAIAPAEPIEMKVAPPAKSTITPLTTPAVNISTAPATPAEVAINPIVPELPVKTNIERTIDDLNKLVQHQPDDTIAQLALRCLYSAYGQNDKALKGISKLSANDQARALGIAKAMMLTAQATDPQNNEDTDLAGQALEAIDKLREQVAQRAEPSITTFKVCNRVDGFGRYEEVDLSQLQSGKSQKVLVYCELENFKHKRNAEGKYLTQLAAQVFLYDSKYRPVVQFMDEVTDLPSFNPRRDFFMRGALEIPALAPGQYQLVVTMEDKVSSPSRWAQPARIDFEVKAPPAKTQ